MGRENLRGAPGATADAVRSVALHAGGLLLLAALFLLATRGLVEAVLAVGVAVLVLGLVALGPERLGTVLLLLGVFAAPMSSIASGPVTLSDLLLVLAFVLLAPRMLAQRVRPSSLHLTGAFLLLASACVASLLAPNTGESLGYLVRLMAALLLLPLALLLWHPSSRQLQAMAWAYVLGHVVSTFGSVVNGGVGNRLLGLTEHPNFFGICSVLAAALCLYLILQAPEGRRWLPVLACGFCLVTVLLSGSRAALLASVVIAVVFPVLERSAKAGYLVVVAATVGGAAAGALIEKAGPNSAIGRLAGKGTASGSDRERIKNLEEGWDTFLAQPFSGTGFSYETSLAHNGYLEVATAFGIVALVGYALVLWSMLRVLLRTEDRNPLGYLALAYMMVSFFNNTLWDRFAWIPLAMVFLGEQLVREERAARAAAAAPAPLAVRGSGRAARPGDPTDRALDRPVVAGKRAAWSRVDARADATPSGGRRRAPEVP